MRTRTLLLLATSFTVCTIAACAIASGGATTSERVRSGGETAPSSVVRAAQVLAAWDRARAAAWARGDPIALVALYARSSATGARDVADLSRWHERRLRVVGLRQQVARLRVLVARPRRVVVEATERTVDATAVARHRRTALPDSAWATHRIRFRRVDGRWVVVEVKAQPAR